MADSKETGVIVGSTTNSDNEEGIVKDPVTIQIDESAFEQPKSPLWRRILSFIWDSADGDPEYRRYVRRLDLGLFPIVCLGYFIKYLDQTNYSNAFVSGMQEDLSLYGNERNWLNTWFALGIIIGSVPAQMSQLSFVRPSVLIPTCEIMWSALVISMGFAKNIKTMYALRFFVGLLESCAFPGYIAILGSWYGPQELAKRTAILLEVESIASMFSGYLQAGLYNSMNGHAGLAGWRWLFVMDGVISIPIALAGFVLLPNNPYNTKAFYWSAEHIRYGIERVEKFGQQAPKKLTLQEIKRIASSWQLWVFVGSYTMIAACHTATSYFNLWLKAEGYSVDKINYLPTGGNALAIVVTLAWGMIADRTGQFYWLIISLQFWMILSNILLSVWNIPKAALMFAYYISYAGSAATPVFIAWGAKLNAGDPNLRQLLVAVSNVVSYAWVLWVPLVLFPTYDAPKYKYGYQILILFGGLAITFVTTMKLLYQGKE
ncbi:hypothetical protein M409DRAFT_37100 [Zasmidium cellare ATCC 36951]|uniref:Major facilitator superfamily (MFS) profile domain-containing protein n=1 Tax=Zasmidium cellare ATCC 36951 TaxID=1080233 RepID=A0A6A6CAJ2_ZASCE|nr:uncharacterized protein M409DRAFT_37100 [Zasmidium cellare ATCC 36951]KAF2164071.1 hypothetical protein M409DRAFT_37100 [Zasmidium cellare ATCC 36951]